MFATSVSPVTIRLKVNVEIVASQMASDVSARQLVTFEWFSRHDHHLDSFGAAQKRQCVGNRARGLTPSVPAQQNAIECEPSPLDIGHNHHGSPRLKQGGFDDQILWPDHIGIGLTDNGQQR